MMKLKEFKESFLIATYVFIGWCLAYMFMHSIVSLEFFMSAFTAFISLGYLFQFIRDQIHYNYLSPSFSIRWHESKFNAFFHICMAIISIAWFGFASVMLLLDAISRI